MTTTGMRDNRNAVIVSTSIGLAMLVTPQPTIAQAVPAWLAIIFGSGVTLGSIVAIVLNLLFFHVGKSRGPRRRDATRQAGPPRRGEHDGQGGVRGRVRLPVPGGLAGRARLGVAPVRRHRGTAPCLPAGGVHRDAGGAARPGRQLLRHLRTRAGRSRVSRGRHQGPAGDRFAGRRPAGRPGSYGDRRGERRVPGEARHAVGGLPGEPRQPGPAGPRWLAPGGELAGPRTAHRRDGGWGISPTRASTLWSPTRTRSARRGPASPNNSARRTSCGSP